MTPDYQIPNHELPDYKLRMKSKRLESGKMQIDFSVEGFAKECYGYLLADPHTSVSEVIRKISKHADAVQHSDRYHQRNLFSLCKREVNSGKILIFKR